jgi:hypothetical protein
MNAKTIYMRGVMRLGPREKKSERASKVFGEAWKKDGEAKVSVKLVAFAVIAGLAIFGYSEVWGVDWKYYGMNEEGTYFYETETMTRLSQNIVRVCVQSIYTEKGISHWVKGGGKEFQVLDFSLILSEFNCAEKSIRHLRIVFYSKNGEVFYPIKNEEWHFFAPDSMSGTLFNEVCK